MAEAAGSDSVTRTVTTQISPSNGERLVLRLHKPKTNKKVVWKEGVVDNEFHGKKKSKCCCIYSKPRKFNESDSESGSDSDGDCCHEQRVSRQQNHTH